MKIASVAIVLFIGSNCGIVLSNSTEVTQVTETTTERELNGSITDDKKLRLIESLEGDENEIYKTEGEEKNLNERSYVFIDQTMRRPLKIFNLKLERLANSFLKQGYTSKRKAKVFPMEYQFQEERHQDLHKFFVPNIQLQKYVEQNEQENKNYAYKFQQDKPVVNKKNKNKILTETKPPAPKPLSLNYEPDIHRGIKHKLFGQHDKDHSKPKRKFPFARHRLNYNYGIASYPIRRSALRNQVRQNAEQDGIVSGSHPANDKYVQLLEEISNVIDLDVNDVMIGNINENNHNSNRVPCENCFSIASTDSKQKSRTDSLLGCTCENMNVKHEPFGKIIKMLDEKMQSTTESASNEYSMT